MARKVTSVEDKQTEVVETITAVYTKNVERLAEAQKNGLDLALQQNTDLTTAVNALTKQIHAQICEAAK